MRRVLAVLSLLVAGASLVACSHAPAPVEESVVVTKPVRGSAAHTVPPAPRALPEFHAVERGETLYSIAFRYGLDFRALAAVNGVREPYTIYPGQKLRLRARTPAVPPAGKVVIAPPSPAAEARRPVASGPAAPPPSPAAPVVVAPATAGKAGGGWQWPVQARLLSSYNPNVVGPKGIALAGNTGDPVRAARDGRVVYIGSSLVGYGQLVILKHDDVYLSAYAHNSRVLVKEGDAVRAGDTIAEMGATGTDRTKLHFEVRRNGDPIDPLTVLPRP